MNQRHPSRQKRGFTLIEVLITVSIMGIAAAIVVPNMLAAGTMGVQAATRMVIADTLFAQNEAIAQQAPRRVKFDVANNRYSVTNEHDVVLSVNWKGGGSVAENYIVDFNEDDRFTGVRITAVDFNGNNYVEFDALGAPNHGGTIDVEFDNQHYRVTVAEFTGRVTVAQVP